MKLSTTIVSLFIATGASLPAFAASAAPMSPLVETVAYRQTHTVHHHAVAATHRDHSYRAYDWTAAGHHPGWPCVHGDPTLTSSFPSWETGSQCH